MPENYAIRETDPLTSAQVSKTQTGDTYKIAARTSKERSSITRASLLCFVVFFVAGILLFQSGESIFTSRPTNPEISSSLKTKNDAIEEIASEADGYRLVGGQWIQIQKSVPANRSSSNLTRLTSPVTWAALLIAYIAAIFWLESARSSTQLLPSRN